MAGHQQQRRFISLKRLVLAYLYLVCVSGTKRNLADQLHEAVGTLDLPPDAEEWRRCSSRVLRGCLVEGAQRLPRHRQLSTDVRGTVLRIAAQQPDTTDLDDAIPVKFEVLTACEREFGLVMPHAALNDVRSVDDAVSYWEGRLSEIAAAEAAAAQHFTVAHPPNVVIGGKGRGEFILEWRRQYARQFDHLAADDSARESMLAEENDDEEDERLGREDEEEQLQRALK